MKSRKSRWITPALIIPVVALAVIFLFYDTAGETAPVVLPTPVTGEENITNPNGQDGDGFTIASITNETVQAVVSTLERAESYTRTVQVENFWSTGSSATNSECYILGDNALIQTKTDSETRFDLITNGEHYVWYDKQSGFFSKQLADESKFVADNFSHMITYEELLKVSPEAISEAAYQKYNGFDCVFAEFTSGNLGYITRVFVSVDTGLLIGAERYDGETLVYRMTSTEPVIGEPNADIFKPPS